MYHIAQVNIARLIAAPGDPQVQGFFDNVDRINNIAEASDGFKWRFIGEYAPDPTLLFNISIWASIEQFSKFVYRSEHVNIMRRKDEWTRPMNRAHFAMWWVTEGTTITPEQSLEKLHHLDKVGPSEHAFNWDTRFAAPTDR